MRSIQLSCAILVAIACFLTSSVVMAKHTSSIAKHSHHTRNDHTSTLSKNKKKKKHITVKKKTTTKKKATTKKHTTKSTSVSAASADIYGKHRLIAYVVDWEIPSTVNWDKVDHVAYAFAEPDANGALKSFTDSLLKKFTTEAHKNKVGVSISVGGWSGSKHFSTLVKSSAKRKIFVDNIVALVDNYDLDGVNLDWEYPNDPNGVSCNAKDKNDTANYLVFIQELRKALDAKYSSIHKLITVAVGTNPFNDAKQTPMAKLDKNWASAVDSFYIMAYDISGSWNTETGPNAPLLKGSTYDSSVAQAVSAWHSAGIPSNQLIVGVPFYGLALKTSKAITSSSGLFVKLAASSAIKGDEYDESSKDDCPDSTASYSGGFQWRSIVKQGILKNKNGWKSYWDNVSETPYAYQPKNKKFLSFDDTKSLKEKVDYINKQSLGGAMIWSLEMDDSSNTLLNSIQGVRKE
ncbi:unnamed protein product [Mucor fragilis]